VTGAPEDGPPAGREAAHRARRAALLEAVSDHILAHGLGAATLRDLGAAAGTSDRMLLYYFSDKSDLVEAALDTLARRLTAGLDALRAPVPLDEDALRARLVPAALDPAFAPFMRLWLEMAAAAARGDALCHAAGRRIAQTFLDWIEAQLAPEGGPVRRMAAARILAAVEGLIVLRAVGFAGCVEAVVQGQPARSSSA
jgi:AcrR family transcriptional regulator